MPDHRSLIRTLSDYARTIVGPYEVIDVLYRLTDQAVDVLGVDSAGVSLDDDGDLGADTASSGSAAAIEEMQAEVAEGPCYDAHRLGRQVTTADLTKEDRWAEYTPRALEVHCVAAAGIPMWAGDTVIGALNLYRTSPWQWQAEELEIAQVLANMAAGYVVNARTLSASNRLAEQLQRALDSRVVIEQAKGILAGRSGATPQEAFEVMRSYARRHGRKLREVAQEIVEERTILPVTGRADER